MKISGNVDHMQVKSSFNVGFVPDSTWSLPFDLAITKVTLFIKQPSIVCHLVLLLPMYTEHNK